MNKQVIVYTTKDCIECTLVNQMLIHLNIPFELRDVTVDPQYQMEVEKLGFLGVPVTVIGEQAVKGYHPEEIKKLLESK